MFHHSDFDVLIPSHSRIGELSGGEDFDASGDAGLTSDDGVSFEGYDHLVDRRRADTEVALDVGFGGWASEHVGVGMDEGEVMTLLLGEARA